MRAETGGLREAKVWEAGKTKRAEFWAVPCRVGSGRVESIERASERARARARVLIESCSITAAGMSYQKIWRAHSSGPDAARKA